MVLSENYCSGRVRQWFNGGRVRRAPTIVVPTFDLQILDSQRAERLDERSAQAGVGDKRDTSCYF